MKLDWDAFGAWLRAQGADVLAPTNEYEVARFRANGAVHVVYRKKNGSVTHGEFGGRCIEAFKRGQNMAMGFTANRRSLSASVKASLLARDGDACFFCGLQMPPEDMTIEHLVGKSKGGPDHTDNLVLAHEACNQDAGNMPLMEKIKVHCASRYSK